MMYTIYILESTYILQYICNPTQMPYTMCIQEYTYICNRSATTHKCHLQIVYTSTHTYAINLQLNQNDIYILHTLVHTHMQHICNQPQMTYTICIQDYTYMCLLCINCIWQLWVIANILQMYVCICV